MLLKRLLVGSISLSDDVQLDEELGEVQAEGTQQNADSCQSTGELRSLILGFFNDFLKGGRPLSSACSVTLSV